MALRDQPYLPLYIQDFLTDEKLIECSASATGVYIRIMCIMHKSNDYGKILLNQKDKQNSSKLENFTLKLAKHLPYSIDVIRSGIVELLDEKVLHFDDDCLCQKRMIEDNELSLTRSLTGSLGGKKRAENKSKFGIPKSQANTEYEYEYETEDENVLKEGGAGKEKWNKYPGEREMGLLLNPVKGGAVKELFGISKKHTLTDAELNGLWEIFKKQNFDGAKYYDSANKVYSHFINWSKTQNINATHKQTNSTINGRTTKSSGAEKLVGKFKDKLDSFPGGEKSS